MGNYMYNNRPKFMIPTSPLNSTGILSISYELIEHMLECTDCHITDIQKNFYTNSLDIKFIAIKGFPSIRKQYVKFYDVAKCAVFPRIEVVL